MDKSNYLNYLSENEKTTLNKVNGLSNSLSKKSVEEIIPIVAACNYAICNDTGFAHIASGLGLKCLVLFMDSPPIAYGTYSKNISIIVPEGESIESCGHNTRGKDKILFNEVLDKSLKLVS